ncbi:MAG TPA: molybdenum ABC transporter ATP-binding protein [Sedimenticola sp.]|nr:molybdenum ABC transporter ATP-binding protein [Sedimenticola sp.]
MSIRARFRLDRGKGFRMAVDLELPGRGVTALFGPSGCGKTTLLRLIAGLERAPGGELWVGGHRWQGDGLFLPPHRRPVGYVFQEASLFPHLDVRGNLEYGLKRLGDRARRVTLEQVVELLGIGGLLVRRPDGLSGGERQRVAIARALAVSPRLLLMDEPLAALDRERRQEILPYLESLHRELEIPVLYVSHAPDEVARLADFMVLMAAGRVQATGPIDEILTRLDLPMAGGPEAEALIQATVAGHDDTYDLTYLAFPGGRFTVTRKALPLGARARLRVLARDVSLTLERQSDTSILNIFPARVEAVAPAGSAQVTVRLRVGGVPLLSRITRKSADALMLVPGKRLYAQAKSVALLA